LENNIVLNPIQEKIAQNIFAFDLLIQNNDRRYEKPNMLTDGNDLIMLDHELAFGFHLVPAFLRTNNDPWRFNQQDMAWINIHCLLRRLRGKVYELDFFGEKMANLDVDFWNKAERLIPREWFDKEIFDTIKTHVNSIVEHRQEFIENIKFLLS